MSIKAVALDVDGVLTDSLFIWGPRGEEFKQFSFRDVMGISLAKKAGLAFAVISGEDSPIIDRFAQKMGIEDVYKGCKDKATAIKSFAKKQSLELSEVCFVGDDINDVPALGLAGLPAVPADAHPCARQKAVFIATHKGGRGAVREILDYIMENGLSDKQKLR